MTRDGIKRGAGILLVGGWLSLSLTSCVPHDDHVRHLSVSIWGSVRQAAIEESIARLFEQTHPDVHVDVLSISNGYQEKIQAMIVGGSAPDVMMIDNLSYADWGSRGALLDVTDLVKDLDQQSPFMPVPRDAFALEGRYYGVPVNAHGVVMYCNLDALKSAGIAFPAQGLTWEQFAALGPRLARHAGNPAAPTDYLCVAPPPSSLMMGFGVHFFDDPHHPQRVTLESPEAVAAIDFLRRLYAQGWAASLSTVQDAGSYQLFRDGHAAFFFMWRSIAPELTGHTAFRWDVAPFPHNVGGVTEHGGTLLGISRATRQPDLAREYLRFYAAPAATDLAVRGGRIVPVRRAMAYGSDFLALGSPPSMARFSETMESGAAGFYLYTAGTREVFDICAQRLQQAVAEPGVSSAAIVHSMQADLERWLVREKLKGTL